MSIDANGAVANPRGSTGPRTEEGKATSARNSTKHGLFTAHDFIRDGEEDDYAGTVKSLWSELSPDGTLEEIFTTEIVGATWRLRRCRLVEEAFGAIDDLDFDPMMDERTEKQQKSVDRARAQSHLILRRSIAELTKLQKVRFNSAQQMPEQPSAERTEQLRAMAKADFQAMVDQELAKNPSAAARTSFCKTPPPPVGQVSDLPSAAPKFASGLFPDQADPQTKDQWSTGSFCKTPKDSPRNAPCPCNSGLKYKRCCGNPAGPAAKPPLDQAA